jgi:hypothetical protein
MQNEQRVTLPHAVVNKLLMDDLFKRNDLILTLSESEYTDFNCCEQVLERSKCCSNAQSGSCCQQEWRVWSWSRCCGCT